MWHEARKQEKKIRGMLVDYRRRAERRQDFYERIKADPTQFMQVHGRKSKIHLDPAVAIAGDSATIMMPWQGQKDNIIDRFDARAHLDFIPPPPNTSDPTTDEPMTSEERQTNYERFRILAQNEFLGITEEKFLQQLHLEEQYGVNAQQEAERVAAKKAQKSGQTGAAIGYTYEDSTGDYPRPTATGSSSSYNRRGASPPPEDSDSDSDVDVDVCININKLDVTQGNELNKFGRSYGMLSNDFYSFLTRDADEAESLRLAREEEQEKVLLGGRKSRRERRAQREKKFTKRFQSPPSYASREEDFRDLVSTEDGQKRQDTATENESRSPSPVNSGVITYITSFGGEDEPAGGSATGQVTKAKNQTMSRLQQLKSQLTLGSIIGEKREELQAKERMGTSSKDAIGSSRKAQVEIVAKPLLYRRNTSKSPRRSRSRSRGGRRDRYDRSRSRSRSISSSSSRDNRSRHRRDDRSRRGKHSNSRKRSVDRRRRSSSYSPRRRRSSESSSRSSRSSSSSSSYERRRKNRKSITPPKQKSRSKDLPKESIIVKATTPVPVKATVEITSPVVEVIAPKPAVAPPPPQICLTPEVQVPVKKYYGRRKEDHSDSELSYSEDETNEKKGSKEQLQKSSNQRNDSKATPSSSSRYRACGSNTPSSSSLIKSAGGEESKGTPSSSSNCNPRDRLKRKMQSLLNKQYKADKKAEHEKTERQMLVQQERNEEMRELAIKLRKRQRELRHKTDGTAYGQSSDEGDDQEAIDDFKSHAYSNTAEDEEERQIQTRLHKLVAMSRSNDDRDDEDRSGYRRGEREKSSSSHQSRSYNNDRGRDHDDSYEYTREKRSRRRESSRDRDIHSSSTYSSSRRRDSRDERTSPSRSKSSRWDVQQRKGKSPPPHSSSSGNSGSRSRRLVDY